MYVFNGRSEHSRETNKNASLNQFITFVQKFKNYKTSSLGEKFSDFFARFESFKFFLHFD